MNKELDFSNLINQGLLESNTINIFWKDNNRRFVGVNNCFLKTYGISDASEIIGKTDEEMLWHVDDGAFANDEWRVLKDGEIIKNRLGSGIINGVAHNIVASKEPLYKDGQIVGLIGTFMVLDEITEAAGIPTSAVIKDRVTGLMSATALADLITKYVESYRIHNENFCVIRISLSGYINLSEKAGDNTTDELLRKIGEYLYKKFASKGMVARLFGGNFVVVSKEKDKNNLRLESDEALFDIEAICNEYGKYYKIKPVKMMNFADEVSDIHDIIGLASGGTIVDIEERKQLEEKLNNSNVQMNTLIDAIPGGVAIEEICRDKSLKVVYSSAGVARLTGLDQGEYEKAVSDSKTVTISPQDFKYVDDAIQNAINFDKPVDVSYRIKHKNGRDIWINRKGRIIGEQNGNPLMFTVFQKLSDNDNSYEMALDEAAIGVLVNSTDVGEIIYINNTASQFADTYFNGDSSAFYAEIESGWKEDEENFQENTERKYEISCRGRILQIHIFNQVWNGRKAHIVYFIDNTEDHRAYTDANNLNEQLKTIIDRLPGAIIVFKRQVNRAITVEYVSAYARKIFENTGLLDDDSEHRYDYIYAEDREYVEKTITEYGDGNKSFNLTYRIVTSEGRIRWVRQSINAVLQSDGSCLFYAVYDDITKEMKFELERKATLSEKYGEYFKINFNSNDIDEMLSITEFQGSLLTSIANAYISMHVINVETRTFLKIWCMEYVDNVLKQYNDAQDAFDAIVDILIKPESHDEATEFFDLSTLSERIADKKIITYDYSGSHTGWCRGIFIPTSFNEDGMPKEVIFMVQPIQSEKMREENLKKASEIDGLSLLYNHKAGEKYVNEQLKNGELGTFYLLDIDKFKSINDNYGHSVGDKVIFEFSECMRQVTGERDILIRLGGDEFAVFVPGLTDAQESDGFVKSFQDKISKIKIDNIDLSISASVGRVTRSRLEDYPEFDTMYKEADNFMYRNKRKKHLQMELELINASE